MSKDSGGDLQGYSVLLVEDDYFIASDMRDSLEDLGCHVMGPFASVEEPLGALDARTPDIAILDVNLSGDAVYPLASALRARKIPMLFVTGYDPRSINDQYQSVPRLMKPINGRQLQKAVRGLLQSE
jgi:two-component SAPR family response regulator